MSDSTRRLADPPILRGLLSVEDPRQGTVLWLLIVGFALSDTFLTIVGLGLGFSEVNPVARSAIHWLGPLGLVGLKLVSLAVLAVIVRLIPVRFETAALLGFCLPQAAATGVNAALILSVTAPAV